MSTPGYIRAVGDQNYNFGNNDFTVEFFAQTVSNNSPQTLFEITNNESFAANNYNQTRFLTVLENGNINSYAIQTSNNSVLFSINGNKFSSNTTHFVSTERKDNKFYLYLDGVSQSQPVNASIPIPAQYITNNSNSMQLSRVGSPALMTIGADKNGSNAFIGSFGDFRVTNGIARHVRESQVQNRITSEFTDIILGTRAEDINISGGEFVDSVSSYAPEELVPGQIFDSLNISVYQNANCANLSTNISNIQAIASNTPNPAFNANALLLGFRIFKDSIEIGPITEYDFNSGLAIGTFPVPWNSLPADSASVIINGNVVTSDMWSIDNKTLYLYEGIPINSNIKIISTGPAYYYSIGASGVSTLTQNLYSTDSTISVANVAGFITPDPSTNIRGKIFINEECITYLYIDRINNVLSGLRRGVNGTGVPNNHIINNQVISASYDRELPGIPGKSIWYNLSNTNLAATNSNISNFLVSQGTVSPV
jgi:hypothetical protein